MLVDIIMTVGSIVLLIWLWPIIKWGALIFLAILLDHLRHRLTAWIMHRENVRRLMRSSGRGPSSSGQTADKADSGQKQST
jgi:hypothetical protein